MPVFQDSHCTYVINAAIKALTLRVSQLLLME